MALVNPNIAMSFKPTTEYQPRNVLAEYAQLQQIQGGQMQMAKLKRDEEALNTMMQNITANGGPENLQKAAADLIKSRNPAFMEMGFRMQQTFRETQQTRAALGLPPLPSTGTPTGTPAAQPTNALAPTPPISGALGSGTFDPMAPAVAPVAPTNALAPTAAPAGGMSPELRAIYEKIASPSPAAQAIGKIELEELTKSQVIAPGGTVYQGGKAVYTAPMQRKSELLTPEEFAQQAHLKILGRAPGPTVSVNTQLPASEEAQKEFMKEMRQTYGSLKQAPTVLQNIEDAKKLVPQAQGFMGAGGESMLQAASFLNNRLGTNIDTEGVKSAEELRSRLFLGILDNLKKLDSQPSQQQQAALQVALGSIGTDPNALPAVLDVFGETVRQKVDLYNEEAVSAEARGVKFPYKPTIALKPRNANQNAAAAQIPTTGAAPAAAAQIPTIALKPRNANQGAIPLAPNIDDLVKKYENK